jgi:hypothetical protein
MLAKACHQDTKINKLWFWRLSTATIAITSYPPVNTLITDHGWPEYDNESPVSQQHYRKASDHSEQSYASQMPKKDKGHNKMKMTHNTKGKQAKHSSWKQQSMYHKSFQLLAWTGAAKQKLAFNKTSSHHWHVIGQQPRRIELKTVQGQMPDLPGQTYLSQS